MRKSLLWALAAAVLVSFAGCRSGSENGGNGGNEAGGRPEEKKSLDLSFIPEDCFFAMVIHPKRIADSPLAKAFSEDVTVDMFGEMARNIGVDPRKMEEIVVLGLPRERISRRHGPPFDPGFIIRFSEPIANKELLGKIFRRYEFADEQATHAGKEYYRGRGRSIQLVTGGEEELLDLDEQVEELEEEPRDSDELVGEAVEEEPRVPDEPEEIAVHFSDDRTMVFSGNEAVLKKMLSADDAKSDLSRRLGQLDGDNDLIAVATVEGSGDAFVKLVEDYPGEIPLGMRGLIKVPDLGKAAMLTVDLRADPMAELIVLANDANSAAKLKKVIESAIIVGKALFDEESDRIVRHSPPELSKPLVELVEQTFDAVTVTEDGEKVTATLKRPAALPTIITTLAERGRERKKQYQSANNMHQIGIALHQYRALQEGRCPDNLEELLPYLEDEKSALKNPLTGDEPGYEYVKPSLPDSRKPDTIVLYQLRDGKPDTSLPVLYTDGSVGRLGDRVVPEGDFNIKMPLAAPREGGPPDPAQLPPMRLRLIGGSDGRLARIHLNERSFKNWAEVRNQIVTILGDDRGPSSMQEMIELEIDCDHNLRYEHVINAITAVSGYVDENGHLVRLIEKIKFSPPKKTPREPTDTKPDAREKDDATGRADADGRRVNLPESELAKPPAVPLEEPIFLHATKSGNVILHDEELPMAVIAGRMRKERQRLRSAEGMSPSDVTVIIRADRDCPTGTIQQLIKICQEEQFERFALRARLSAFPERTKRTDEE